MIGVVRRPDGVEVKALHQQHVSHHGLERHHLAPPVVVLVAVGACNRDPPAVHLQLPARHFHLVTFYNMVMSGQVRGLSTGGRRTETVDCFDPSSFPISDIFHHTKSNNRIQPHTQFHSTTHSTPTPSPDKANANSKKKQALPVEQFASNVQHKGCKGYD